MLATIRNLRSLAARHPLTRQHGFAFATRVFRWQFGSKLLGMPAVVPFVNDSRLVVRRGMTGATGNIYFGLLEFEEMGFVLHFLAEGDVFADVGANVGVYSVLAGAVRQIPVIAVEPEPRAVAALTDNLRINGAERNVTIVSAAVGAEEGVVAFTSDRDTMNHVIALSDDVDASAITVPLLPLDAVFEERVPTLVKLDVEGFERPALAGATRTLGDAGCKGLIVEINGSGQRYGLTDEQVDGEIRDHGFIPVSYDPLERRLQRLDRFRHGNTIYVKDVAEAEGRLRSAPAFNVLGRSI